MSSVAEDIREQRLNELCRLYGRGDIGARYFMQQKEMVWREYDYLLNRQQILRAKSQSKSGSGDTFLFYTAAYGGPPNTRGCIFERGSLDLSGYERDPVICDDHDRGREIARAVDVEQDPYGALVTAKWRKGHDAQFWRTTIRERIERGKPHYASVRIGAPVRAERREWLDGQQANVITRAPVQECSLTFYPSDTRARVIQCT